MSFRRYAAVKIIASVVVLWLAITFAFVLFFVVPRDPALDMAGKAAPPEVVAKARSDLHLDRPILDQYRLFLSRTVLHHDLGYSYYNNVDENTIVGDAAPVTLSIVGWGLFYALLIAVPLGLALERRQSGRPVARAFSYVGQSVHPVWIGLTLAYFVGYRWHLTPITLYSDFFNPPPGQPGGAVQWAYHLILPGLTSALAPAVLYTRAVRSLARDVRRAEDKARSRSRALTIVLKGVLRDVGWLMGWGVFVETVYSLPGLGRTMIQAFNNFDQPTVAAALLFATFLGVGIHLVGDLIGAAFSKEWRRT